VDFLEELYQLPVAAIGLDMINGSANLDSIKRTGFPDDKTLIAGIVNGRNVWRTNIGSAAKMVQELSRYAKHIAISNASPLYHLPITIKGEALDPRLLNQMAFAEERLYELQLIAHTYEGSNNNNWNQDAGNLGINPGVRDRMSELTASDFIRTPAYSQRVQKQQDSLHLPLFPTSTIGSFPQSPEVRRERAKFRRGEITTSQYQSFIRDNISSLIQQQEELGLDVLVHGEFERTDMVEFFAEKLEGIATTKNGWILSYGTRGYRPPIIYGDISRPQPMSLDEIVFAQSLTPKPVKGMLTGPITMIAWSFVREDISTSQVAYQISLCLKDEISDYERNGIRIVQIDEPAFREKAPIKKRNWKNYFDWAVKSFRLCSSQVKPETQIQTHMCYSEFGEIIEQIARMDFDVITIEASRSKGDILEYFEKVNFDRQIGLGVWDIHSPAIPSVASMKEVTSRALQVLPRENMWINPDCGLKTRKWQEVLPSLRNMVTLAQELRKEAQG
jgi:5-methyltetrahydropteroyltriglutamate--homocysteine methyltransferase